MAYIVMAYIVMAYVVMACIVMACIVMANDHEDEFPGTSMRSVHLFVLSFGFAVRFSDVALCAFFRGSSLWLQIHDFLAGTHMARSAAKGWHIDRYRLHSLVQHCTLLHTAVLLLHPAGHQTVSRFWHPRWAAR